MSTGRKHKKSVHNKMPIQSEKNPVIVGLVHANWCGHCKQLMPEWNRMEENISKNPKINNMCKIVKIESEHINEELPKYSEMTQQKNIPVQGYPTIFMIKQNRMIDMYGGERNAEALERWISQATINQNGGKKSKTRKNRKNRKTPKKTSKNSCKSCKKINIFKFW